MNKLNIVWVMVLLVGCGQAMPTVDGDVPDAQHGDSEVADGGTDAGDADGSVRTDAEIDAGTVDSGTGSDAEVDAGSTDAGADAATPDSGADAGPDATGSDAGTDAAVDAGSDSGMMDAGSGRGVITDLGVNGNTSCVLTSTNEMWCWGGGITTPMYVADAVALEGNCGIGLDGRILCWTNSTGVTYANIAGTPWGSDAAVVGVSTYVSAADGNVHRMGYTTGTYTPSSTIDSMPADRCAIYVDGSLHCWDSDLMDSTGLEWPASAMYNTTDVARTGDFAGTGARTGVACRIGVSPMVGGTTPSEATCTTHRSTLTVSTDWTYATEVDIDGGRACVVTQDSPVGAPAHAGGVYCTTSTPNGPDGSASYLCPLEAPFASGGCAARTGTDSVGTFTAIIGTQLQLGANHACIMQAGNVLCWGDNAVGQLGNGSTTATSTPTLIAW